jgi:hypothetical protein
MYLPNELAILLIIGVICYLIYLAYKLYKSKHPGIEDIEVMVDYEKKRLFEDEPITDCTILHKDFNVMEKNYLRLKQRLSSKKDKRLEIAQDRYKYAQTLNEIKFQDVMLTCSNSDNAYEEYDELTKETYIIKDEIEKKLKLLLGKDWQELQSEIIRKAFKTNELKKKSKK